MKGHQSSSSKRRAWATAGETAVADAIAPLKSEAWQRKYQAAKTLAVRRKRRSESGALRNRRQSLTAGWHQRQRKIQVRRRYRRHRRCIEHHRRRSGMRRRANMAHGKTGGGRRKAVPWVN